jgi:O-methyltransferase domain
VARAAHPTSLARPRLRSRAALALRRRLLALADAVVPPHLVLFERGAGVAATQLLRAAARLRLADRLEAGPRTADELAAEAGVDPDALFRCLRALAALGVFALRRDGRFAANRLSRAMRSGDRGTMRDFLEYLGSRSHLDAWADLDRTLADGRSAFERVHGRSFWRWLAEHPDEERTFAATMVHLTELDAPAIAAVYPFGELGRVCDVAGGRGALLAEILRRHPRVRGVLLDAPHVVAGAPAFLADRGVASRVECVGGSFFDAVPAACDGYVLKDVLHDWSDATCLEILATCRRAARPGARILVTEMLVERLDATSPGALADVQMMVVCDEGRQRSAAEHQALLARAGFAPARVFPLDGPSAIVEGVA